MTSETKRLFIASLHFETTRDEIRALLAPYGRVADLHLATDHVTGRSRGFAFAEMSSPDEASAAIEGLDGREVGGRCIHVTFAKPRGRAA